MSETPRIRKPSPERRRTALSVVLRTICWIGLIGMGCLILYGLAGYVGHRRADVVVARYAADEQRKDDLTWMLMRDVARRHLSAVRTGAVKVPDDELGDAMVVYAGYGKRFWRKPEYDPTDRLAAVKVAADRLRPLEGPRISCPETLPSKIEPRCAAYFDAMVALFGRDL
jgi:hypothetical protein